MEAVIFQPLPLTRNEKTTVDNFFKTFVGLQPAFSYTSSRQKPSFIAIALPTSLELMVPNYSVFLFLRY